MQNLTPETLAHISTLIEGDILEAMQNNHIQQCLFDVAFDTLQGRFLILIDESTSIEDRAFLAGLATARLETFEEPYNTLGVHVEPVAVPVVSPLATDEAYALWLKNREYMPAQCERDAALDLLMLPRFLSDLMQTRHKNNLSFKFYGVLGGIVNDLNRILPDALQRSDAYLKQFEDNIVTHKIH